MVNKFLVGLGAVLVLAVLLLVANAFITGKATKVSCVDTDGGSIFVKGTVSGTTSGKDTFEVTDYCGATDDGKSVVKEYSCDLTQYSGRKAELVYCDNGCQDGACLE